MKATLDALDERLHGLLTRPCGRAARIVCAALTAFGFALVMAFGGPIGASLGAVSADAFGRRPTIIGASAMASSTERVCRTLAPRDAISSISSKEILDSLRALDSMRGSVV